MTALWSFCKLWIRFGGGKLTCKLLEAALEAEKKLGFKREVTLPGASAGNVADDCTWLCKLAKGVVTPAVVV